MGWPRWALPLGFGLAAGCARHAAGDRRPVGDEWAALEADNPVRPLPAPPLGVQGAYADLKFQVTPQRVRLGRWLFFDRRLSADGTVSCASCHDPRFAFSERRPHSLGIRGQQGTRKAPALVNAAFPLFDRFFWDGRASSLVEQAQVPMTSSIEMGSSHQLVVTTVSASPGYRRAFQQEWPDGKIDLDRVAEAIAAYEATRMSGRSPFDRFDQGEAGALDQRQVLGRDLFLGQARCTQCHLGWDFTDSQFHNLGVGWRAAPDGRGAGFADPGRARISGRAQDTGAFKTPTVRDAALHPPYMHDGSLATLRDVVEFYNRGGTPNPWLDPKMGPLGLAPFEVDALVAFIEALSGEGYQDTPPRIFPAVQR